MLASDVALVNDGVGDDVVVTGSAGADTITLQVLNQGLATETLQFTDPAGITAGAGLTQVDANTVTVLTSAVTGGDLFVNTGDDNDTVQVLATSAGLLTTVDTQVGLVDEIHIGNTAAGFGTGGSLNAILGDIVAADLGSVDLFIDNSGDAGGADYLLQAVGGVSEIGFGTGVTIAFDNFGTDDATIEAGTGSDVLTVDFSNGDPLPFFNLNFNGGDGGGNDSLVLADTSGATLDQVTHNFTNASDGSITAGAFSAFADLNYTGLEPIVDNLSATDRVFNFNGGAETITLSDDGAAGDGFSFIDSTLGESVTFANPTNSLTINAGTGEDLVELLGVDAATAPFDLIVSGGLGDDTIDASALAAGALTTVTLNGDEDDDTFLSTGAETIDGAAGNDTVDFSAATAGIIIDLDVNSAGAAGTPSQDGGILDSPPGAVAVGGVVPAANILFEVDDIENVIGTTLGDGLFGNNEVNVLQGGAGADSIHGFAGDDFLEGGADVDTVLFSAAPAAVTVNLNLQVTTAEFDAIVNGTPPGIIPLGAIGGAGNNVLSSFENITGSANDDTLTGDGNGNLILGAGGLDDITLSPGASINEAIGGDPAAVIPGDDLIVDLAGVTGAVLTLNGTGAGQVTFASGQAPIDFSEIESVDAINGTFSQVIVNTGGGDDAIGVSLDGGDVVINVNGFVLPGVAPAAFGGALDINGEGGNDTLTVDSSAGFIAPVIRFDGGAGFDAVNAVQDAGPTVIEENLFIGATPGNGIHELVGDSTQTIEFSNLEPFTTNVPAPVFNITSTPGLASLLQDDNQINYEQGALLGPNAGRVTVDDFEPIEFINKVELVIDAGAGDDLINLNNPNAVDGLTGITVNAGDPTASDTVIVNGTAGLDDITVDTLTDDGAVITGAQPVPVTIDSTEALIINGGGGNDDLTVVAGDGNEVFFTPGTSEDSGAFSTQSSAFGPFQEFLPVLFQDLGAGGELSVESTAGTRTLDLVLRGTDVADDFVVDTNGEVQVFRSDSSGFFVTLPIQTPGVSELFLEGLAGDDLFSVEGDHPFTQGVNIAGGQPDNGSDELNFNGNGGAVTIDLDAGTVTEAGFAPVSFAGIETVNIDANALLTVVGTAGDDVLDVTPAGVDSGSFTHDGTPGVLFNYNDVGGANGVVYDLGDGQDQLNLLGDAGSNNFLVEQDADDAPLTTFVATGLTNSFVSANLELLTVNGLGGDDTLTVDVNNGLVTTPIFFDGGTGSDTLTTTGDAGVALEATYTPGLQPDEGRLFYDGDDDLTIDFDNLEPVVDLIVAASLTVNGNADDNQITYSLGSIGNRGLVSIDGFETIEFENKTILEVNALGGDDTIVADNDFFTTGLESLVFNGDEGDDTIRFDSLPSAAVTTFVDATANGGSGDDIIDGSGVDLDTPLLLFGDGENDTLIGGAGEDSLSGGLGDDTLVNSPGDDTFDGGGGLDTLVINGSNTADLISVFQEEPSAVVGGDFTLTITNGSLFAPPAPTTESIASTNPALAPNNALNLPSVERVEVNGQAGDDVISIGVSDEFIAQGLETQTLAFGVDGGLPNASDRLVVLDDGLGDTVIQRAGADDRSGSFTIGATAPIDYKNIGFADLVPLDPIFGTTGTDNNGRLVVFKNDPFESNNSLPNATFLGAGPTINVDPTIDPAGVDLPFPFPDVPGDSDFFQFVAQTTGTLDFQLFFEPVAELDNGRAGLPGDGELVATFFDNNGTVIGTSTPQDIVDADGNKIGERVTLPVVIDETYFVQVQGETVESINVFNFTAIIDPAPIPQVVDLFGGSAANGFLDSTDSGRNNTDDVTFFDADINGPAIFNIVLDDDRLEEFLNQDLIADDNDDGGGGNAVFSLTNSGGLPVDFGIEVFNNGESIGFATFIEDSTWQFIASAGDLNEGDFNHVSAAVIIRDAADPAVVNRGGLSLPLQVELDTIDPPVQFGVPTDLDGLVDSSDSGVVTDPATFGDLITNDTTPTFVGQAEANSIVRLFADVNDNGLLDIFDQLVGQTTAIPIDGNLAEPDGFWEITSAADLNELFGVRDGLRRLFVTAEDLAGNVNDIDLAGDPLQTIEIFIDTQGPQVTDVFTPDDPAFDLFAPSNPANGFTPLINSLTIDFLDQPNRLAPNFLYNALQQEVAEAPGNYLLVGDRVGIVAIDEVVVVNDAPVDGTPATASVTLTFFEPLPDDRFSLILSDNLVDPAGNNLDGESNADEPNGAPTFPSGDGVPGSDFVARFTVDSRPELGTAVASQINIDINGNQVFDPATGEIGGDFTNVDLSFSLGRANLVDGSVGPGGFGVNDLAFAGQFFNAAAAPPNLLFDQLAAFGFSAELGAFRFLVDTDSDGVVTADPQAVAPAVGDIFTLQPTLPNFNVAGAIPVAGNFDNNAANGDEIGLYFAGQWALDSNRNFVIEAFEVQPVGDLFGHPVVGDFDGNGIDDFAVFNNNQLFFDLNLSQADLLNTAFADDSFIFGFPGVLDRPVAADFDQDGVDDIGLFIPGNSAGLDRVQAEWRILVSGADAAAIAAAVGTADLLDHPFETIPFGNDIFAEFGDELSLPIVGNFDPPIASITEEPDPTPQGGPSGLAGDYNSDNIIDKEDFAVFTTKFGADGASAADGNSDSFVNAADFTILRDLFTAPPASALQDDSAALGDGESSGGGAVIAAAVSQPQSEETTQAAAFIFTAGSPVAEEAAGVGATTAENAGDDAESELLLLEALFASDADQPEAFDEPDTLFDSESSEPDEESADEYFAALGNLGV